MSTHFTYEIDERKLRVKLKDIESPLSEDAWRSFELYSGTQTKNYSGNRLKEIQLPLNRNIIVPVVFGALVILFSIVLFNFIDIKKPAQEAEQKKITPQISIQDTNQTTASPAVAEASVTNQADKNIVSVNVASAKPLQTAPQNTLAQGQPTQVTVNKTAAIVVPETASAISQTPQASSGQSNQAVSIPTVTQNSVTIDGQADARKKKKRRNAEVLENDSSNDSRPIPGSDDRDLGGRPN